MYNILIKANMMLLFFPLYIYGSNNFDIAMRQYHQHKNYSSNIYSNYIKQLDNNNKIDNKKFSNYINKALYPIRRNENTIRRSLAGKASTLELLDTSTEAKQYIQTVTVLRDELLKSLEKVLSIQM